MRSPEIWCSGPIAFVLAPADATDVKKCPECKFLLTENVASCRFCGHLLGGLHTNDSQALAYEPGVDLTSRDPQSMRAQPVVRRAGDGLAAPDSQPRQRMLLPPRALVSGEPRRRGATSPGAGVSDAFEGRPPTDNGRESRWPRVAIASGGLVLALAVGGFFYLRTPAAQGQVKAEATAPVIVWERVGPPTVPLTAELPGPSKGVPLRPFEDRPTVALQAEIDHTKAFVVGAFDLPEGALVFGADAYLRATAERIAAARATTIGDGLASDRREGRVYAAQLSTSTGGGGFVHVLLAGPRVYFAAAFVASDPNGVRPLFDRVALSLAPA